MMATYDYERMFYDAAQSECRQVADDIVNGIKTSPRTPVDTGLMRDGYESRDHGAGAQVVQTAAEYWSHVEYGTSEQQAQPHVRPEIEAVRTRRRP